MGPGTVTCTGASIRGNRAVDGGGAYVDHGTLNWACDLVKNSALSGPAM